MIKLLCYSQEKLIGTGVVTNGEFLVKSINENFVKALQELSEKGIPLPDKRGQKNTIFPKDKRFILLLEKFLSQCGFRIIRVDTELISKLKQKMMTNDKSISESSFNEMYGNLSVYEASLLLRTLDSLSG